MCSCVMQWHPMPCHLSAMLVDAAHCLAALQRCPSAMLVLHSVCSPGPMLQSIFAACRRAPGSADMRAALAALYWHRGQQVSGVPTCARQHGLCLACNTNACHVTCRSWQSQSGSSPATRSMWDAASSSRQIGWAESEGDCCFQALLVHRILRL